MVSQTPRKVVLFLKAMRMVEKGCLSYLAPFRDTSGYIPLLELVLMVSVFAEVIPTYLLGIRLDRNINFGIDLDLDTQSISIPSYRMTST